MSLLLTCACGTDRSCLTFSCTLNLILNMESDFDFLIVGAGFSGLVKEENVSFVGRLGRNRYFNNGPSDSYGAQGILQNR